MPIGVLVTARMGSSRLPDKHLRPLAGRPALSHLLMRIEKEFAHDVLVGRTQLVLATGNEQRNAALAPLCTSTILFFCGNDNNVPRRHLEAAEALGLDAIVSVDGDDLFCAPEAMRAVHDRLAAGIGLVRTDGLPLGMNCWGYSTDVLRAAVASADQALLETGWGRIFNSVAAEQVDLRCQFQGELRATLDYDEDLAFFAACIDAIPHWDQLPTSELVDAIAAHGMHKLNLHLSERYWANFAEQQSRENGGDMNFSERLNAVIPGGAHTYSRGDDQYPSNAPQILERGEGAYVWSPDGRRFLDYGMALRAVSIGYAEPEINAAARRGMELGNNLTRASMVELEAAELLVSLVDSVDMVKFTKNGSTATSAAVKLARAYTGRDLVARCAQHPFFSYDDWFIGSTPITKGIPATTIQQTKTFAYNDIASLETLIDQHPGQIACVILEPAAMDCPAAEGCSVACCSQATCTRGYPRGDNYLKQVERLCRKHGIVFILDEMITGFRWHMKGAQHVYGVTPDLCTFGKAMANGFSVAAVAGRRELMELGSIDKPGRERLFLLSTTHGAEMSGLSAFIATMNFLEQHKVLDHLWHYGADVVALFNRVSAECGTAAYIRAGGPAPSPWYLTMDSAGTPSMELRTLFAQELIKNGVLMPWLALSFRHGPDELEQTELALRAAMSVCARALTDGFDKYLSGRVIKPVFRRFN